MSLHADSAHSIDVSQHGDLAHSIDVSQDADSALPARGRPFTHQTLAGDAVLSNAGSAISHNLSVIIVQRVHCNLKQRV